jgi:hypothetical protein
MVRKEFKQNRARGAAIYRASSTYLCGRWSLSRSRIGFIYKHQFLLGFALIPIRVIFFRFPVGKIFCCFHREEKGRGWLGQQEGEMGYARGKSGRLGRPVEERKKKEKADWAEPDGSRKIGPQQILLKESPC